MGRAVRHQLEGAGLDDEAVALVEVDVGPVRGLEVAVDPGAVGDLEHRLE
jgi:hypothetical protein